MDAALLRPYLSDMPKTLTLLNQLNSKHVCEGPGWF